MKPATEFTVAELTNARRLHLQLGNRVDDMNGLLHAVANGAISELPRTADCAGSIAVLAVELSRLLAPYASDKQPEEDTQS